MRILLNGLISLLPKTGIGHYIDSLHAHLPLHGDGDDVRLFPSGITRSVARRLVRFAPASSGRAAPSRLRRWLSSPLRLARNCGNWLTRRLFERASRGCSLYHEPNYIPFPSDLPTISTVHDLSVLLHPEWHPAGRVRNFEAAFEPGLRRCRHIIADTEAVRREIIQHLGIAPGRVTAVHLGVRPAFRPLPAAEVETVLRARNLPRGFLLHVGTIEPRKNLEMLVRAYLDLPCALRDEHPLVLIGNWGWRAQTLRDFHQSIARHQGVVHIGYVPEQELPALYNAASALVFPSHYEGFGFPPLEMMACGGAVLASNAAALAEILPPDRPALNPNDFTAWRDALTRILRDREFRDMLAHGAAAHAACFSWDACARKTWQVYRQVVQPVGAEPLRQAA